MGRGCCLRSAIDHEDYNDVSALTEQCPIRRVALISFNSICKIVVHCLASIKLYNKKQRNRVSTMNYSSVTLLLIGYVLLCGDIAESRHNSDIIKRPKDVVGADCGEEIKMTCVAKAKDSTVAQNTAPDIEWWFRNSDPDASTVEKIRELEREGRIEIRHETFMAVRSILTIRNAQVGDQGVYQCRASASPDRHNEGINPYQHWKIEEAPVNELKCGEQTITTSASKSTPVVTDVIRTSHRMLSLSDEVRKTTIKFDVGTSIKSPFANQTFRWGESLKTTAEGTAENGFHQKHQERRSTTAQSTGNAPGGSVCAVGFCTLHFVPLLTLFVLYFWS